MESSLRRSIVSLGALGALVAATTFTADAAPPEAPACPMFPADNYWHADVSGLPVHPSSATWIQTIGRTAHMHADFGSGLWAGGPIGIPYVAVSGAQPRVPVSFEYDDESDPGPYPIPADPPIEGGSASSGDRHILIVDRDNCDLWELYAAYPNQDGSWRAGSGAFYDLTSNALRPSGWTSADAAGLPILPGLVRYDEILAGRIDHAIRFTAPTTQRSFIWPARHQAGSTTSASAPPMGAWLRLRADYPETGFSPEIVIIIQAMKRHGLILADNGSPWYISGVPDARWNNDHLHELDVITGNDFQVVDTSSLVADPNSGRVGSTPPPPPPSTTPTTLVTTTTVRPTTTTATPTTVAPTTTARPTTTTSAPTTVAPTTTLRPLAPVISRISPTRVRVGAQVTVRGRNLLGTTSVTVGGQVASFTVVSATTLTFTVPAGFTKGKVAVTTPGGQTIGRQTLSVRR